ncbi:MAG: Tripartite DNA replication factor [Claussenomyces sp. TS43310]|nr:MAG: Tripartite DNA replication factor [Claussenomyces sp. TS43310]
MPLQKCFSEQNHSSGKSRAQWSRNRSYQGPTRRDELKTARPAREQPPIQISSNTMNKLNLFQFGAQEIDHTAAAPCLAVDATVMLHSENKENEAIERKRRGSSDTTKTLSKDSSQPEDAPIKNEGPATPAARLALPDLIGMIDAQRVELEITPDEHVTWNHDRNELNSPASSYRFRRGKRARSSSPTSSPAHASSYLGEREAFDLKRLSQSLRTPQIEPGSALWDRYALSTDKSGSRAPQIPALAHIMCTSSPQSSKEHSVGRGGIKLQRSNSCGAQWPKRRKTTSGADHYGDDVFTGSVHAVPSKLSRVSALLEKVQGDLTYSTKSDVAAQPSSSSPAACRNTTINQNESSPIRSRAVRLPSEEDYSQGLAGAASLQVEQRQLDVKGELGSSDYGDFDDEFDVSTVQILLPKEDHPPLAPTSDAHQRTIESRDGHTAHQSQPLSREGMADSSSVEPKSRLDKTCAEEDDEFGDMDDDNDLELILASYDKKQVIATATTSDLIKANKTAGISAARAAQPESEDEFGGEFEDFDFEIAEAAATEALENSIGSQAPTKMKQPVQKIRSIQRYLVTNVIDSEYENARGRVRPEKVLLVQVERTKTIKSIILRDGWFDTPVTVKAFVHVIGDFQKDQIIIDDVQNMIIVHPDHLISSTVVADSFSCTRRAVLQDRVKATSESSLPLVYGTILHEIFQAAMVANRWDTAWLSETIETIATRHLEALYTIKLQIPQAVEYLQSKMGELQSWAEVFVSSKPKAEAVVKTGNGESAIMCVSKVLDVEEHVWSPMYGLKGNIDATVQVTMQDGKHSRTLTAPFEVKTGKSANAAHRAQTALYNLLLSDRYDVDIAYGILYYMETSQTIRIPAIRHELRHMIMQRNELACFVRERHAQLPPMLKKENLCNRCYAKVPCFIYHRLADDGTGETSGLGHKFDEIVKHLTPRHRDFFLKWDDLLTKEEKESLKFRRELWTMLSSERESLGRCFANVIIEPGSAYEEQSNSKINRFRYTLIKEAPSPGFSFLDSQIIVGEPIVISDEKGHFALANGYVTHVRKHRITVAVDRRLHNARIRRPGFNETNNQVFASLMEVAGEGATQEESSAKIVEPPVKYRLDKDEFSNGMATVRNNMIQVMADGPFGSREIRSLVIDLVAPRFKYHSTAYVLKDRANINIDQRRAIEKVMSAQDYALVLGMPGTGKTTTIAHIIRALVSQGKSVLLTSYTHTAVDNILLKLRHDDIPILRLGSVAKVNAEVQEFASLAARPKTSFEEIRSAWHDSPVVATTCLGINHPIFNERTFDYCIVDEASQITLPVCLGPIRLARTFILVGDHNQLPPLVQNEEARTGGLDISLFKHLSDMHPSSVVNLEHQYRMCEDVMTLSNSLIYSGRLKCGTQEVATRSIHIPNMDGLQSHHYSPATLSRTCKTICLGPSPGRCWIRDLLNPSNRVRFVNTDTLLPMSREEAKGNRIVNPTEAEIVTQLVKSLISVGVPASSIGVMTHYRSQLALLRHGLRGHHDIEMHTADRFQGRDKEVVVLSLVRSNEARSIGELLKDWRRINVAFTRAKTKLLIVGSRETLKGNSGCQEMVAKFVGLMEDKLWIYDLPKDALDMHLFEDGTTPPMASAASRPAATQWKAIDPSDATTRPKRSLMTAAKGDARAEPKRARLSDRALLLGKPVLRDIVNDVMGDRMDVG